MSTTLDPLILDNYNYIYIYIIYKYWLVVWNIFYFSIIYGIILPNWQKSFSRWLKAFVYLPNGSCHVFPLNQWIAPRKPDWFVDPGIALRAKASFGLQLGGLGAIPLRADLVFRSGNPKKYIERVRNVEIGRHYGIINDEKNLGEGFK